MAHIYWKGGNPTGGNAYNAKVQANWVYIDGTTISNDDWTDFQTSGKHDIIFDYTKNWGTIQTPKQAPSYVDMNTWNASATTVTWKSLTIKYNASSDWCKIIRWNSDEDTLVLRGLDIRKSKMLSATIATTIKFAGVPYFTSHRRNKGMGTATGAETGDIYVRIVDTDDKELSSNTFISKDIFDGSALGKLSYTAPGMFWDEASRNFITFLFEPPNNTVIVLEDGIYPDMDFDCAGSDTATLSFDDVRFNPNTYTNKYEKVDMLKLTIDSSFDVKPTDHSLRNRKKYIQIREGYDLDCATFDMGYATLEIVPSASSGVSSYLPSNDTAYFGPTPSATVAMGMDVKYTKLVIGTPKDESSKLLINDNSVINCEELVIKPGGRLYGPTYGDSNSAEIHCVKYPIIEGDWNFSQVAEGIYRASGTNQVLPASRGGTGLSTYGKQGQVLAVKSNGQGLEWSSTAGGGGVTVQEEGSSLSTVATTINFTGSNVTASGTGAVKTVAIGDGGVVVQEEGSALSTTASTLNFVGSAVTAAGTGTTKTITITDSDTVYTHPTTAGNKHIPAGGASGNFLEYSSDGTAVWATPSYTTALAWSAITSKPSTFAPIIGTTSTTAMAGNTAVDNVSKANLITAMAGLDSNDTLNIGDAGDDTNVVIRGNLQVDGTTTTVNSTVVNIDDSIIKLHAGHTGAVIDQDAGIEIERGDGANKLFYWDEGNDRWTVGSETMVAGTFVGALTGNVTGNVSGSANTASVAANATNAANVTLTDNNETDETVYLVFSTGATATNGLETEGKLTYNPNSGLLTTTGFVGALTGNADTATSATSATTATKATNIAGGTIGVIPYQSAANTTALLAGNDTTTKKFLTQTGNGTDPAAPAWGAIAAADVPTLNQDTTGTAATVTTAHQSAITRLADKVGIGGAAHGTAELYIQKDNTSTFPLLKIGNAGSGDAGMFFEADGTVWSIGVDNTDNAFKISQDNSNANLHTNTRVSLTTAGVMSVPAGIVANVTGNVSGSSGSTTGNAATATTAGVATKVTITDNESTDEDNLIAFVAGAASSTGSQDLEMDGNFNYNPSSGRLQVPSARFGTSGVAGKIYLSADASNSFLYWSADGSDITLAADDDLVLHADDDLIFQSGGGTKGVLNEQGEFRGRSDKVFTPNGFKLGLTNGVANKWIKVCRWWVDTSGDVGNHDGFQAHIRFTTRGKIDMFCDLHIRAEYTDADGWWNHDFNIYGPAVSTSPDNFLMVWNEGTNKEGVLYYKNNDDWRDTFISFPMHVRHGDNPSCQWQYYNTNTGSTSTPTTDGDSDSATETPNYFRTMHMGLGGGSDTQYRVYDGKTASPLYLDTGDQRVGIGTGADVKSPLHIRDTGDGSDQWSGIRMQAASSTTSETDLNSYHKIYGFRKSGLSVSGGQSGSTAARSIITFNNHGLRFFTNAGTSTDAAANLSTMKRFEIPAGGGAAIFSVPLEITTGSSGKLLELNDSNTSGTYMGICDTRGMVGYNGNLVLQGGFSKGISFCVNNGTFGSGAVASFDTSGTFNVVGAITAATKEFVIDHPTKPGMKLHHGSLEGPEHAVYVRGQHNASVITLPDYWKGLVDEDTITVQLTPIGEHQELFVKQIKNGKVRVASKKRNQMLRYFYLIHGERKDVEKLEIEV